jgi:predicted nucleic acid-binding protein
MKMILVDSNILLDLASMDSEWYRWSSATIEDIGNSSELGINQIIYAEASIRFASPAEFDNAFPEYFFRREPLPYAAAFIAGKAFAMYKKRGGTRASPPSDFYIGAHAAVAGFDLLTRDPRRFRQYFPTVKIIAP